MIIPRDYESLQVYWQQNAASLKESYQRGEYSYIPNLLPEQAVAIHGREVLATLYARLGGDALQRCFSPNTHFPSPVQAHQDTWWIRRSNMVGVNIRTIGSFWNLVKYALTLPAHQDSIHILPIWEPGVVASLYGIASWRINTEFFSEEMAHLIPQLNTVEKQLHAVVNLLHAMGKKVGMDVIPHTDRYSEIVLANPQYFEWLQRDDLRIINHEANLHHKVQSSILSFLKQHPESYDGLYWPDHIDQFFSVDFPEEERLKVLFGQNPDFQSRNHHRGQLIEWLFREGYEPIPATMAPPYRGLEVDPSPEAQTTDAEGRVWRDYRIMEPQEMSRVFGPLTRFKLYERLDDNREWEIDFSQPRPEVWDYVCHQYAEVQRLYNFDFMRGDMSHVQMRADGVPAETDEYYDLLEAVLRNIRQSVPYFGYFAETFLTPPGYLAYGNEIDHLEQTRADVTLGDLQSRVVGSPQFMQDFRHYLDIAQYRKVVPSFTILTGDKDDPRFDEFYLKGNEARFFTGLFLTDMPSYMALGFECRDTHLEPAPNEHYTKLYVFHLDEGPKATNGPYRWGQNGPLFHHLTRLRLFAEKIWPEIAKQTTQWILPPDPTAGSKTIAWTQQEEAKYLFVVNLDVETSVFNINVPKIAGHKGGELAFSTADLYAGADDWRTSPNYYHIDQLLPGEGRCYRLYPE